MKELNWKKGTFSILYPHLQRKCVDAMSQIDKVSNHKWHFFRKLLNPYDFESREIATNRAFYKLWEIFAQQFFEEIDKVSLKQMNTLHLAEAPGSFVHVIKLWLPNSKSVAVTKPPSTYADVVKFSRTIPNFSPVVQCLENTHLMYIDLLQKQQIVSFLDTIVDKMRFEHGFDLITADGGFDEEERYNMKEVLHYNLILNEIICILQCQAIGGHCIIKVFDTYTETTLHILNLLTSHYTFFEIVKPITSRPTNAEKYIICKNFKGLQYDRNSLIRLIKERKIDSSDILDISIPDEFRKRMYYETERLATSQINAINSVMEFIINNDDYGRHIDRRSYMKSKDETFTKWKREHYWDQFIQNS